MLFSFQWQMRTRLEEFSRLPALLSHSRLQYSIRFNSNISSLAREKLNRTLSISIAHIQWGKIFLSGSTNSTNICRINSRAAVGSRVGPKEKNTILSLVSIKSQSVASVAEFWFCNTLRRVETAVLKCCETLRHSAINGNASPTVLSPTAIPEK